MVKMSVLADCLKKIVNAEKAGKRQAAPASDAARQGVRSIRQHT